MSNGSVYCRKCGTQFVPNGKNKILCKVCKEKGNEKKKLTRDKTKANISRARVERVKEKLRVIQKRVGIVLKLLGD